MTRPIYLDYHATTPVDPRALEAMLPYFTERFGNAASKQHAYGWEAQKAVDTAREQVAALIGASSNEICLHERRDRIEQPRDQGHGALRCARGGEHLITVVTEHKSVLDSFKRLESDGLRVTWLGVDREGFINLDELRAAITPETDAGLDHGGEQRDRHASSRSPRSARSPANAACSSTPTRRRPPARCRSTSTR